VRRRLDETKLTKEIQSCRTPTNAEVREHLGARLNRTQRLLDRLENGETLDQRAQQQAYLSQQGERKALGKSLEEGCDHQTAREDRERPIGNEGPPGQRSAVGRACSRSELCRKTDRSRKRIATLMSEAGNIPAPAAVCTTSR
jgi:hypothetical protein